MMTFLNPLDTLIPKIPFSFFAEFWVRVTSRAPGSVLVGFWGARQLSLLFVGGRSQRAVSTHPLKLKTRPPKLLRSSLDLPRFVLGPISGHVCS